MKYFNSFVFMFAFLVTSLFSVSSIAQTSSRLDIEEIVVTGNTIKERSCCWDSKTTEVTERTYGKSKGLPIKNKRLLRV